VSVTKLRETTEKKGCMIAVWVVMVLTAVGVAGSGFFGCFNPGLHQDRNAAFDAEVLVVDGRSVSLGQLNGAIESFMKQFQMIPGADPDMDYPIIASTLRAVVDQQIMANMAAQRGVVVTQEQILAKKSDEIDAEIRRFRLAAVTQADLKETATEAEFQKYFEEKTGESTSAFKERVLNEIRELLKDEKSMQAEIDRYSAEALQESFYASTTVTDEEARRSFDKLMMLRIAFDDQEMSLVDREAKAKAALAELRGGADFFAVQKKYMKNPIKEPTKYGLPEVERSVVQRPLAALKPGEVSEVITEFGIPTIYKLVEKKSEIPADFDTNKAIHTDTVRREKASLERQKAIDDAHKKAKVVWKSPGYAAMYRVQDLRSKDAQPTDDQVKAVLREIVEKPIDAADDPAGPRPGVLARYGAMKQLQNMATPEEKKQLLPTYIAVLTETLTQYESVPVRLDLVDLYVEKGDTASIAVELRTAAEMNTGLAEVNSRYFAEINAKLADLESKKLISDADALAVRDVLSKWSLQKKEAEDYAKKAQEDLDKFNLDPSTATAGTTGAPPATTGTTGGSTGSAATTGATTTGG
jgi:hypothetical protein